MYEWTFMRYIFVEKMYKSIPERENQNDVDHYYRYADIGRIIETLHARGLKRMVNI
jgi:hypothetical protein